MIGKQVRIHPASDWFMRGVTNATVVGAGRARGVFRVRCWRTGVTFRIHEDLLMDRDGNVIGKDR